MMSNQHKSASKQNVARKLDFSSTSDHDRSSSSLGKPWITTKRGRSSEGLLISDSCYRTPQALTNNEVLCSKCKCSPAEPTHKKPRDIFDVLSPFSKSMNKQCKNNRTSNQTLSPAVAVKSQLAICKSSKSKAQNTILEDAVNCPGRRKLVSQNEQRKTPNGAAASACAAYDKSMTPTKVLAIMPVSSRSPVFHMSKSKNAHRLPSSTKIRSKQLKSTDFWKVDDSKTSNPNKPNDAVKYSDPNSDNTSPIAVVNNFIVTNGGNASSDVSKCMALPRAAAEQTDTSLLVSEASHFPNASELSCDLVGCTPTKKLVTDFKKSHDSPVFKVYYGNTRRIAKPKNKVHIERLNTKGTELPSIDSNLEDIKERHKRNFTVCEKSDSLPLPVLIKPLELPERAPNHSCERIAMSSLINTPQSTCSFIECSPRKSRKVNLKKSPIFKSSVKNTDSKVKFQNDTKSGDLKLKKAKEKKLKYILSKSQDISDVTTQEIVQKKSNNLAPKRKSVLGEETDLIRFPVGSLTSLSTNNCRNLSERIEADSLLNTSDFIGSTPVERVSDFKKPLRTAKRKRNSKHQELPPVDLVGAGTSCKIISSKRAASRLHQRIRIRNLKPCNEAERLKGIEQLPVEASRSTDSISDMRPEKGEMLAGWKVAQDFETVTKKLLTTSEEMPQANSRSSVLDASLDNATCDFIASTPAVSFDFKKPLRSLVFKRSFTGIVKRKRNLQNVGKTGSSKAKNLDKRTDVSVPLSMRKNENSKVNWSVAQSLKPQSPKDGKSSSSSSHVHQQPATTTESSCELNSCTPKKSKKGTKAQLDSPVFKLWHHRNKAKDITSTDVYRGVINSTPPKIKEKKMHCDSPIFKISSTARSKSQSGNEARGSNGMKNSEEEVVSGVQRATEPIENLKAAKYETSSKNSEISNAGRNFHSFDKISENSELLINAGLNKSPVIFDKAKAEPKDELFLRNRNEDVQCDMKNYEPAVTFAMVTPKKPLLSPIMLSRPEIPSNLEIEGDTKSPDFISSPYLQPSNKKTSFIIGKSKRRRRLKHDNNDAKRSKIKLLSSIEELPSTSSAPHGHYNDGLQEQKPLDVVCATTVSGLGLHPKNLDTERIEEFDTEILHLEPKLPKTITVVGEVQHSDSTKTELVAHISQVNSSEDVQRKGIKFEGKKKWGPLQARMESVLRKNESERRVRIYEKERGDAPIPSVSKDFRVFNVRATNFPLKVYALADEGLALVLINKGVVKNKQCVYPGCWLKIYPPWNMIESSRGGLRIYMSISTCDVTYDRIPDLSKVPAQPWTSAEPYLADPDLFIDALLGKCFDSS